LPSILRIRSTYRLVAVVSIILQCAIAQRKDPKEKPILRFGPVSLSQIRSSNPDCKSIGSSHVRGTKMSMGRTQDGSKDKESSEMHCIVLASSCTRQVTRKLCFGPQGTRLLQHLRVLSGWNRVLRCTRLPSVDRTLSELPRFWMLQEWDANITLRRNKTFRGMWPHSCTRVIILVAGYIDISSCC